MNKKGEFGAASLYPGKYAVHDGKTARYMDTAYLFEHAK